MSKKFFPYDKKKLLSLIKNTILNNSLVSKDVKVINHTDPLLIGVYGEIIDETKNMFTIKNKQYEKKIMKQTGVFEFELSNLTIRVNGSQLLGKNQRQKKRKYKNW